MVRQTRFLLGADLGSKIQNPTLAVQNRLQNKTAYKTKQPTELLAESKCTSLTTFDRPIL